ncbi:MAG TPA: SRPBCC family protein [Trebonia sp.]|nr:SRPBCC family protein [Trebonia sp.]
MDSRTAQAHSARRRLVAHLAAGRTTDLAPEVLRLPARLYTDPVRWQTERHVLFEQTPLVACLTRDIESPGDRLLFEVAGQSVIVLRGADRQVRAFRNRCAHRAARLEGPAESLRGGRHITCPFHGWSYDLAGNLSAVPGRAGFDSRTLESCKLSPVAAGEQDGIVFVRMRGAGPLDLPGHLGSLAPDIAGLELAGMEAVQRSRLESLTNWKIAIDTYAENYHFGALHGKSIGGAFSSNVAAFDDHGPHWILTFPDDSLAALTNRPEHEWPDARHTATYFIFPNTVLVAGDLGADERFARMFRIFPGQTPGEVTCLFSVHTSGVTREAYRDRFGGITDSESNVTIEDYEVAEGIWSNLAAGGDEADLIAGRNEPAIQAFHQAVFKATGMPA